MPRSHTTHPRKLLGHEGTRYFAARPITLGGEHYEPGQQVPAEVVEGCLRSRSLINTRRVYALGKGEEPTGHVRRFLEGKGVDLGEPKRPRGTKVGKGAKAAPVEPEAVVDEPEAPVPPADAVEATEGSSDEASDETAPETAQEG